MLRFFIFLALIIYVISIPVQAQQTIEIDYSLEAHSNSGPLLPLRQSFFQSIELPDLEGRVFFFNHLKISLPLSENMEFFWIQDSYHDFISNRITLDYLQRQIQRETHHSSGEFFLDREKISFGGPGFSMQTGYADLLFESSFAFLINNRIETDLFLGEIDGDSASGRYERIKSPDTDRSIGITTGINLSYHRDPQKIGLYVNNILGFIHFPEIIYRSGQFRYKDYDYDEDGYIIVPPVMRGIRRHRPFYFPLIPEAGIYIDSPSGKINFRLSDPRSLKVHISLGENHSLVSSFPNCALGLKYQTSRGTFYFLANDFRLHRVKVLDLGGAINFSF